MFKRQSFDPSCPSGGSFYACTSGTRFVGCCNDDPCQTGCSDGNLEPASFNPALYGTIQDQECPMGSEWYTCTTTNPPFMGCCKSNPCSSTYGCPTGDVTAGFLSSNPAVAKGFLPAAASSSSAASSPTSASHSSSATSASASASAATLTNTPTHKITTGAIAGGAIGGFAGLALLLALLALFLRRTTAKSRRHMAEGRSQSQGSATRSPVPFQADKAGKATEEPTQNPFSSTPKVLSLKFLELTRNY